MRTIAPRIELRSVSKVFSTARGPLEALSPTSLSVHAGEFLCLFGPSGCGKTTALNMIAGLSEPTAGQVFINGTPVRGPGRDRMMMFQESALFPWRSALGNVLFGLEFVPNLGKQERLQIAREHLQLVGLRGFENHFVHQLSGGMKQRVALARALAPQPHILLMDEPFAALDAMTREQLYADLQRILAERDMTVVLVTHNAREAACLATHVAVLQPRPGRVKEIIDIPLPRPRDINDVAVARAAQAISASLRSSLQEPQVVWDEQRSINS